MSTAELNLLHSGNFHYERGCRGKVRCETLAEAKRGARAMHKTFHKAFNAYLCQFCGGYHTGTRGKRRKYTPVDEFVGEA